MKKYFIVMLMLNSICFASGIDKVVASCNDAKSELIDLGKNETKGYKKDSMKIDIIMRDKKVFVKSNSGESELIYIGGKNEQFIEEIASGHKALYTLFKKQKLLTIQKSYDFFGPIMVNTYLKCK